MEIRQKVHEVIDLCMALSMIGVYCTFKYISSIDSLLIFNDGFDRPIIIELDFDAINKLDQTILKLKQLNGNGTKVNF